MPNQGSNDEPLSNDLKGFLLEDYRLKVDYFSRHLSRMWTRFNYLLTLDSALFALFATRENLDGDTRHLFIITGLVLSLLWLLSGLLDVFGANTYREHIVGAHSLLVNGHDNLLGENHPYVGETKMRISPLYTAIVLPLGFSLVWLYGLFSFVSKS